MDFDITYIDLNNKPDWLLTLSPQGKVPVLKMGDEVLFESEVINEDLDEATPGCLLPEAPLAKAQTRAWIEFANQLTISMYQASIAKDKTSYQQAKEKLGAQLAALEQQIQDTGYFSVHELPLVDITPVPVWMRLAIMERLSGDAHLAGFSKLSRMSRTLLSLDSVRH